MGREGKARNSKEIERMCLCWLFPVLPYACIFSPQGLKTHSVGKRCWHFFVVTFVKAAGVPMSSLVIADSFDAQDAWGSPNYFNSWYQAICFVYYNKNKLCRVVQWVALRPMCQILCLATQFVLGTTFKLGSCLFWPLYKWSLDVHTSFLMPVLRQGPDTALPKVPSCN